MLRFFYFKNVMKQIIVYQIEFLKKTPPSATKKREYFRPKKKYNT